MSSKTRAWLGLVGLVLLAVVVWRLNGTDERGSASTGTPGSPSTTSSSTSSSTSGEASGGGSGDQTDATDATDGDAGGPQDDDSDDSDDSDDATDHESTAPGHINIDDLPDEAWDTLELMDAGGPFPYRQDGVVFENREGRLPDQPKGYYHEYTVKTPGSPDRGARRLIEGEGGELFYTDDHYETFLVVDS